MVKKKQPDFQKIKLKPGRILPRGRNVTNTSFKAKKIIMHSKLIKAKAELTIQECLQNACRNTSPVDSRKEALNRLKNLICEKKDTYLAQLNEIITGMKVFIFGSEDSLCCEAIRIIETILFQTDDMKISSQFPYLMNLLACTMTHTEHRIRGKSLWLLDILLKSHPKLTCQSMAFLRNLHNLLSGSSYNTKSRKKVQKYNLVIADGKEAYSRDWRFQVLAHMSLFLEALLENIKGIKDDDESKELHWNLTEPLHVQLFAGGGLHPINVEKFDPAKFKSDEYDLEDPQKVQEFVDDMMDIIAQMYIEEIADGSAKADDGLIQPDSINNLNILFKVLIDLSDWVMIVNNSDCEFPVDMEKAFSRHLVDKIFKNMSNFPFYIRGSVFDGKSQSRGKEVQCNIAKLKKFHQKLSMGSTSEKECLQCVELNLSVCYLYCAFLLKLQPQPSNSELTKAVFSYVPTIFEKQYETIYISLPRTVQLIKVLLSLRNNSEDIKAFVNNILLLIVKSLKIEDKRDFQQNLIPFFIGLSLEIGSDYLSCSENLFMKLWYSKLLGFVEKMATSDMRVDSSDKLLKAVRLIATRGHPYFLESLSKVKFSTIKKYLLHHNQDIRETAIFLVYNMPKISWEFWQELTDVILGPYSFPQAKAIQLIHLLTPKYSDPNASSEDRVNFTGFLLNLAIDAINLDNSKWEEHGILEFKKAWEPCCSIVGYNIFPSLHWKEHEKLFQECYKTLGKLPASTVNTIAKDIFVEIMSDDRESLPVHTAIAMLKLNNPGMQGRRLTCIMQDLTLSCILFISVFSSLNMDDEWYECNISHMIKDLAVDRQMALDLLKVLEYDAHVEKEGIVVHYILRIVKFLVTAQVLCMEDRERLLTLFEDLRKNCMEKSIDRQPLYINLYNYFCYQQY